MALYHSLLKIEDNFITMSSLVANFFCGFLKFIEKYAQFISECSLNFIGYSSALQNLKQTAASGALLKMVNYFCLYERCFVAGTIC